MYLVILIVVFVLILLHVLGEKLSEHRTLPYRASELRGGFNG